MSQPRPTKLELNADGNLVIRWNDGQRRLYTVKELYDHCPAADAIEKRKAEAETPPNPLAVIAPEEMRPRRITGMTPVGNYAYSIHFSYGSNNGIYRLDMLREIGQLLEDE